MGRWLTTGHQDVRRASSVSKVRYLSQKFVKHLCAQDNVGTELVREIESVIFSNIDPTDTLNASNFEELRAIKTEATRAEGSRIKGEVVGLIHEESVLREQVSKIAEKNTRMKTLADEADGLKKQMPPAATPDEARAQASLQEKYQALNSVQQEVAGEKQKLQKIGDIRSRVTTLQNQFTRAYTERYCPVLKISACQSYSMTLSVPGLLPIQSHRWLAGRLS